MAPRHKLRKSHEWCVDAGRANCTTCVIIYMYHLHAAFLPSCQLPETLKWLRWCRNVWLCNSRRINQWIMEVSCAGNRQKISCYKVWDYNTQKYTSSPLVHRGRFLSILNWVKEKVAIRSTCYIAVRTELCSDFPFKIWYSCWDDLFLDSYWSNMIFSTNVYRLDL